MKKIRVYVDTSVFGGLFDEEFRDISSHFFEQFHRGEFSIVTSAVVIDEISLSPPRIQEYFRNHLPYLEVIEINNEILDLRDAYLSAKILPRKYSNDALHVAFATVSD